MFSNFKTIKSDLDKEKLFTVNSFGQMMIATRHGNTVVNPGDKLAGMRIIPLVIEKEKMDKNRKSSACRNAIA